MVLLDKEFVIHQIDRQIAGVDAYVAALEASTTTSINNDKTVIVFLELLKIAFMRIKFLCERAIGAGNRSMTKIVREMHFTNPPVVMGILN